MKRFEGRTRRAIVVAGGAFAALAGVRKRPLRRKSSGLERTLPISLSVVKGIRANLGCGRYGVQIGLVNFNPSGISFPILNFGF